MASYDDSIRSGILNHKDRIIKEENEKDINFKEDGFNSVSEGTELR